jgi:hypothetical protein
MGAENINVSDDKGSESSSKSLDNQDIHHANPNGAGEARMTRAKFLACLALGLSYTTAFQQGAW